ILSNHPRRPAPQAASLRNLCTRRLPRLPRVCRGASRDPGRTTPQAASLRNLCVLRVSALDSSSLGLTFNLQLSTFNRVSFLSSQPSLSQCSAKSFTIRTSETPLPQLLYNPHLQAPLGSAGNKGLITPLESALTKNSPVSLLESAVTKRWGVGCIVLTSDRSPHCLGTSVATSSSVPAPDFAAWLLLLNFQLSTVDFELPTLGLLHPRRRFRGRTLNRLTVPYSLPIVPSRDPTPLCRERPPSFAGDR